MDPIISEGLRTFLLIFIGLSLVGLVLSLILLAWIVWRVKRIPVPPDADFLTTLRYTPLSVVILLDVLDLTFDFLAAPFAWILLGYLNLQSLRTVTVVEAVIPGTQFLPTMTAAWLFARFADAQRQQRFRERDFPHG